MVEPEVTRDEIIGGERVVALPSEPPQACQKVLTNYVLRGHIVPGWRALDRGSLIEDPCLVRPFAVETLFDPGLADNAVAEALYAKGNPVLRNWVELGRAKSRAEAEVQGWAETILKLLKARDLAVSPAQQQEILGCHDLARLDQWSSRAAVASSTDELLSES